MDQKIIGDKKCSQQHVLGRMLQTNNGEILELFRLAIDYSADCPEPVDVLGLFPVGYRIRCSICGELVDWHESARRQRYSRKAVFE
ncbi:MAG TPA: hypothetical protein DCG54_07535 [Anaerolineae bacterium]|jgi:hypothetical protein|nr:hypothetical protein [Anaerolineae bacterium]